MRCKLDLGQVDEGSVDGVRLMTSKVSFLMTCCRGEVFFNIHVYIRCLSCLLIKFPYHT